MLRGLAAAVAVGLLLPGVARAGTVSLGPPHPCTESACYSELGYAGAPGEVNTVAIRKGGGVVTVRDATAPVTAPPSCSTPDPHTAVCPDRGSPSDLGTSLAVGLGDGDDAVVLESDFRLGSASLSGGPGADRLVGGPGDDRLHGGPGADRIDGRTGFDTLDHTAAPRPVQVDLARGEATSEGATDRVASIEQVLGGAGGDVLLGGTGAERLAGGPGDDRLEGRGGRDVLADGPGDDDLDGGGGDDRLQGQFGPTEDKSNDLVGEPGGDDRLSGGPGDDRIVDGSGRNRLLGGPGDDRLTGGAGADRLDGGLGRDRLEGGPRRDVFSGGPGDDRLLTRDDLKERVACGTGADSVDPDRKDRRRGCERRRRAPA